MHGILAPMGLSGTGSKSFVVDCKFIPPHRFLNGKLSRERRFLPSNGEANRKAIAVSIDCSYEQKIIPRRLSVDELFNEMTASLGS